MKLQQAKQFLLIVTAPASMEAIWTEDHGTSTGTIAGKLTNIYSF